MEHIIHEGGSVSINDLNVSYGFGIFETFFVQASGEVFLLERHIQRMYDSLVFFDFPITSSKEEMVQRIRNHIQQLDLRNQILRVQVSFGNREKGIQPAVIMTSRRKNISGELYETGCSLSVSGVRRNESSFMPAHKTTNYMENYLEGQSAVREGFYDTVFLNTKDFIAETSKGNVFFVHHHQLWTPDRQCGILPGITRGWVISEAEALGVECLEGKLEQALLYQSEEVFITNAIVGILSVQSINGIRIQNKSGSKLTLELMKQYRKKSIE